MKKLFLLIYVSASLFVCGYGQVSTVLSGEIKNLKRDSVKIVLQFNATARQTETIMVPVKDGKFTKGLSIIKPTYLYVTDGANYVNGLVEPGDHTTLFYDAENPRTSLQFEGKGKEKFTFFNNFIRFELYKKVKEQVTLARQTKYPFDHMFHFIDSVGNEFINQLNKIKTQVSPASLRLLKADIAAIILSNKNSSVGQIHHEDPVETLKKRDNELTPASKKYLQHIMDFDNNLAFSHSYVNTVYNMLFMHYDGLVLSNKMGRDLTKKYDYLNSKLPVDLKTPVLTLFLESDLNKLNQGEDLEMLIAKIYASDKTSVYKKYILKLYTDITSFKKGTGAPDFILENEKGEKVTLASFQGKVIFIDFWYGACVPCHALFQRIKPVKQHFSQNQNVVFLNVSIDRDEVWKNALEKYKIDGYHVFTENRESNHPVIKAYKVHGYPTTCLIDKNGKIFMATPSNDPEELTRQINDALSIVSN